MKFALFYNFAQDGQSFTRRRTRGRMYEALEPVVYSPVYIKKSPSLGKQGMKGKSLSVAGGLAR